MKINLFLRYKYKDFKNNMDEIKTHIANILLESSNIKNAAIEYFPSIENMVRGNNIEEYNNFNINIKNIDVEIEIIKKLLCDISDGAIIKNVKIILNIFNNIESLTEYINFIYELINREKYLGVLIGNKSQTFTDNIYNIKNLTTEKYKHYKKHINDTDVIFKSIIEYIDLDKNVIEIIDIITKYKNSNKLIFSIIQNIINNYKNKIDIKLFNKIKIKVEELKSNILYQPDISKIYPYSNIDYIQRTLIRNRLVPVTDMMPLSELFELLNVKYNSNSNDEENIKNISTALIGTIIIYKIYPTAIEYNILPLINIDYVNERNLMTSGNSGINPRNIKRFTTIKKFDAKMRLNKPPIIFNLDDQNKEIYIFETIDNIRFRIISNSGKYLCDTKIINLLHGVSLRPHAYNKLLESAIINTCYDPNADTVLAEYDDEKKHLPSSDSIIQKLLEEFNRVWILLYKNNIPKNEKEFKQLALTGTTKDEKMSQNLYTTEIISDLVIQNVGLYGKGGVEYTLTFITKLNDIVNKFNSVFIGYISEIRIRDILFEEKSENDLAEYFRGSYLEAIKKTLIYMDKKPSMWSGYNFSLKEHTMDKKYIII